MWITEHPYVSAGVVATVGVIYLMSGSGGGSSQTATSAAVDPSVVGAGMALQGQQMQLQAHSQDVQAQLAASQDTNATNIAIAKMNADNNTTNMNLQAMLGAATIASNREIATLTTTLQADIAGKQITAAEQNSQLQHADTIAQINSTEEMMKTNAATMLAIQQSNADVQKHMVDTQADVTKYTAKHSKSWMSKIFGM
jgi:hypothetical protein